MSLVVTGTDVKDYLFCPYSAWARRRLGLREPETPSMRAGRAVDALAVARSLGLPGPLRAEVRLADRSLGASGVVDVVAGPKDDMHLLEVKAFRRPPGPRRALVGQLLFYALLASRTLGRPRAAHLWSGGEVLSLTVGPEELEEAEALLASVRRALESESPPPGSPSPNKCASCWYRHVCPSAFRAREAASGGGEKRWRSRPQP